MKVFWDTNVMLDLLGERDPFYREAAIILSKADRKEIEVIVSSISFATVHYILSKYESEKRVLKKLKKFKSISRVSGLTDLGVSKALESGFKDFEDALQFNAALESGCSHFITRNIKDFKSLEIPVMTPTEFLASFSH